MALRAALIALALVLVSCAGSDDQTAPPEVLDVDEVETLYVELLTLRADYVSQCMRDQGFDYTAPAPGPNRGQSFSNPADTTTVGYGIAVQRLDRLELLQRSNEALGEQLSDEATGLAFLTALYGDDDVPGCELAATGRVELERGDDLAAVLSFAEDQQRRLDEDTNQRLIAHPDYIAAEIEWSSCMDAAGYVGLARPTEAAALVLVELNELEVDTEGEALDRVIEFEIALATADTECRAETGYEDAISTLIDELTQ